MTAFRSFIPSGVVNVYRYIASGTAFDESILSSITAEQLSLTSVIAAISGFVSGSALVSGLSIAMSGYNTSLFSLTAHANDLYNNMQLKLAVFCQWSVYQLALSGLTSGQIAAQTSGWFGSISASGIAHILTSGTTAINAVSAAVSGGIPALEAIAPAETTIFNALTASGNATVSAENTAYSGGLSLSTQFASAAGLYSENHNPGGFAVLHAIGTSGFVNALG